MRTLLSKCLLLLLLVVLAHQQLVICPKDKFLNTDNVCAACSTLTDSEQCGVATSTCPFYYWNGDTCNSCLTISNTDASVVSSDNWQCNCAVSYYWVVASHSCVSCSAVTDRQVCNSCRNVFTTASTCLPCSSFANAINIYQNNNDCLCAAGWAWSSSTVGCVTCASADSTGCGLKSCAGYFWSGSVCTACSTVTNANNYVLPSAGNCVCLSGFGWDGAACSACASLTTSDACTQSSCNAFIWNSVTSTCGDCTGIADTISNTPVKGACQCISDAYWDPTTSLCLSCSDATQDTCNKKCPGYLFQENLCTTCLSITYTDVSFSIYAINGACYCQQNFIWDSSSQTCLSCNTITSATKCGTGTCLHYFYATVAGAGPSTVTCTPCSTLSNTVPRQPNSAGSACSCAYGYVWSTLKAQCVACNLLLGNTFNSATGTCTSCNVKNGVQNLNFRDGDQTKAQNCQCSKNYTFSGGSCGCDRVTNFDLGSGRGCGPCTSILGASTPPAGGKKTNITTTTTAQCNCISGSAWDNTKTQCICSQTNYFMTSKGCLPCSGVPKASGSDPSSPYQCLCLAGYAWDPLNYICVCSDAASVIITGGVCISCLSVVGSSGLRTSPIACGCLGANKWNSTTFKCACDPTTGVLINFICKACSTIKGASKSASNGQCVCNSGRKWQGNSCVCTNSTKCPCGTGNFQLASGDCVPCQGIAGATGVSTSTGQCTCNPGFVWSNTTGVCTCQASYVTDGISICIPCNIRNNATSAETSNTCYCLPNHIWNPATFTCDFTNIIIPSQNLIKTFSGQILSCNGLGGSTGLSVDNFNCQCSDGYVWNDILTQCVRCGDISFSTISRLNNFACACNPGYAWDTFTFTCIPFTGTIALTTSSYVVCTSIPSTTSSNLINNAATTSGSTSTTLIQLSDDDLFSIANLVNPLYVAETKFICKCAAGYLWSDIRKRCFIQALNNSF